MKSVFGGEVLEVSGGCSVRLTFKQKVQQAKHAARKAAVKKNTATNVGGCKPFQARIVSGSGTATNKTGSGQASKKACTTQYEQGGGCVSFEDS